jgi:nitroreductase
MLKDVLKNRFTAKWWNSTAVEQQKLIDILECAYLAPSKQGKFNHKIVVLTDSSEAKKIKEYLYWEDTYCLNGVRAKKGPGLRRYNGQVIAPVVLLWLGENQHGRNLLGENEAQRIKDDAIVSATMAMCAAEELGLNTGFNGCISAREIADKLNEPNYIGLIAVGIGYATPDALQGRKVFKDGIEVGFDLSNTNAAIRKYENRKFRPTREKMINYI